MVCLGTRQSASRTRNSLQSRGDRRSQRAEAYNDIILAAVDAKADITLVELA
jgi:hypothetical protein